MKAFKDKVAVITGAASGIGREIAERCAREGMKVVLADIEEGALSKTAAEIESMGVSTLIVVTDVSRAEDVQTLAQEAIATFGAVHLLFNNAGVSGGTTVWESTLADWEWVLGVNLWGVIHGVRTFVPLMLAQDSEGHIINTASIAGFLSSHSAGIYKVTKHGVVSLSETLYHELVERKAKINVSVLCPGFVRTAIAQSERNRPQALHNPPKDLSPEAKKRLRAVTQAVEAGLSTQEVVDKLFQAIREEKFYVLTHPESKRSIEARMEDILQERQPTDALAGTGL